ncbi:MAG: 1-acyl-sn-glycerol-3-phosphate acyltransferase, partial [Actinobacteria bacterium]|nr:1-acyl-sn-glycerol-3-phosphate acyltransferase [Actinomycetota bacterium]
DLPRIILSNIYNAVTRIRVFNIDKIPQDSSVIFAFNHIAGADALVATIALKRKIQFLAKGEYFNSKMYAFFMSKITGSIPIYQNDHAKNIPVLKKLFNTSKNEKISLGIFPEGDLYKKGGFGKFNKGAAYISYKLNWPIVPVYIHNMLKGPDTDSFIGRNEWTEGMTAMTINIGRRINVVIGNPICPVSFINSNGSYKRIVEDINNSLFEEFLRLEKEANKMFNKT